MPPVIDPDRCTQCAACVDVCAEDVFYGSRPGDIPVVAHGDFCFHCNCCVEECPSGAIRLRIPLPQMLLFRKEPT
jgi:adenylylsulfate reductase, subunit B